MTTFDPMKAAFQQAIVAAKGQSNLARELTKAGRPFSQQLISHHLKTSGKCPAELVLAVEAITGVSRHELRPDVFGEVACAVAA